MVTNNRISVVVPVYNEEENVRSFHLALGTAISRLDCEFEIIFVDDGSEDETVNIISQIAESDRRIRCIRLSRNFGSHAALLAGLHNATGDAAVIISADLQDPPETIGKLIEKWEAGHEIVWAVREGREDPPLKKLMAGAFYWLFRRIALPDYPQQGMDFGLFDRVVLEKLRSIPELNTFLMGTIVWLGFRVAHVSYHRRARVAGTSKWPLGKRVKAAVDAIVSFSYVPIRAISYLGITVSAGSFVYAAFLVVRKMAYGLGDTGWASLMVATLFLGGVQMIMLGILGEYIWRANEQVKGRPPYIVMDVLGNTEDHADVPLRQQLSV